MSFGYPGIARKLFVRLLLIVPLSGITSILSAQSILSLFDQDLRPPPDFTAFEPVPFKWNMDGKSQVFMNEGLNELNEHKISTARENFTKVIELEPKFYAAYYFRGVCNKMMLDTEAAENDFENSLSYNDTLSAAHIELGEILESRHEFEKAIRQYSTAMKLSPRSVSASLHIGNLSFVQDDVGKAKEFYKKCNDIDPAFPKSYFMMGLMSVAAKDLEGAMLHFNEALKVDPVYSQALFWRGLLFMDKLQEEKALADWNTLVQLHPENSFFLYMRGYLYIQIDDFDKAFIDLRKSFLANSESEDKFIGGQTILDKRIDLQTAARYLIRKLYGIAEPDAEYIKKGFCFLLSGRYKAAYNWFNKIKKRTGISAYLLGLTFEHSGQHNAALAQYESAIVLDPEIFDAYKKRGIYRMELKAYDSALQDFNKMKRLQPELAVSYRLSGITKALAEDYANAIPDLSKFIDQDSSDRESLTTRGLCFEKTSQWAKAAHDFHRAFQIKRDNPVLSHALDDYRRALKEDSKDYASRFGYGKLLIAVGDRSSGLKEIKTASDKNYMPAKAYLKALKKKE
jgi:tetratricopeptide (TPR) repeat protein